VKYIVRVIQGIDGWRIDDEVYFVNYGQIDQVNEIFYVRIKNRNHLFQLCIYIFCALIVIKIFSKKIGFQSNLYQNYLFTQKNLNRTLAACVELSLKFIFSVIKCWCLHNGRIFNPSRFRSVLTKLPRWQFVPVWQQHNWFYTKKLKKIRFRLFSLNFPNQVFSFVWTLLL